METEIYETFAPYYDLCTADVPYGEWAAQIETIWNKHGFKPKLVLELGCGTGGMTYRLAARGYDMIASDISAGMLSVAADKFSEHRDKILFLQQDMREFELYGTVDAAVSVFDCMNYILEADDIKKVFVNVKTFLNPGGLFVFDANTGEKYARISSEGASCRVFENFSYIWENDYDAARKLNECAAVFFILKKEGLYKKITERHFQRAYGPREIKNAADAAGLYFLEALDADTFEEPDGRSERVYYVLRNGG